MPPNLTSKRDAHRALHRTLSPFLESVPTAMPTPDDLGPSTTPQLSKLQVIGRGTCGTVYTNMNDSSKPTSTIAYKVGVYDATALWNDILLTSRAHRAIQECTKMEPSPSEWPRLPAIKGWVLDSERTKWHEANSTNLPGQNIKESSFGGQEYIFSMSLIPSISLNSQKALMSRYNLRHEPSLSHCLIRPYLGLSNRDSLPKPQSLENFPMTLADFLYWGVGWPGIKKWARRMAAGINGMDIEFVIGSHNNWDNHQQDLEAFDFGMQPFGKRCPEKSAHAIQLKEISTAESTAGLHTCTCESSLYVFDFDKASLLPFSSSDLDIVVKSLLVATTCNDPYFPSPAKEVIEEAQLWNIFKTDYIQLSTVMIEKGIRDGVLDQRALQWLRLFIEQWEEWARQRESEGDGIEFGD
ncbi:hypothetical protein BS50DRAFT_658636 [Corynespora cassiicola Philippines]|uniref:DUF3669 domain-containing protein n=1 Tax=Corynespora cassiicola Philippines TaxID=1448308 RepID=A0A2T2P4P6_CORCC|nr:hypothetical protein BS50DRAFT_658636 [Corynespora cassiicola Philippines]